MNNQFVNDHPKKRFTSNRDWHIYHVYNDQTFINSVAALYAIEAVKNNSIVKASEEVSAERKAVMIDFAIANRDIDIFIARLNGFDFTNQRKPYELIHKFEFAKPYNKNSFRVDFDDSITKTEFNEIWRQVQDIKKRHNKAPLKKQKPPQETDLIYSIFRIKKQYTFKQIFALYQDGKIPMYRGSTSQYKSEDSLERYYNKYRPGR